MATAKKLTHAGRKIADAEVKDQYHDEILNWLIDNLDGLVAEHFGFGEVACQAALVDAKEEFDSYMKNQVEPLIEEGLKTKQIDSDWRGILELDEAAQRVFQTAKTSLSAIRKRASAFSFQAQVGDGSVVSSEVMKRVSYFETKPTRGDSYGVQAKEVPAGYIDLCASIFKTHGFRFKIEGIGSNEDRAPQFYSLSTCVEFARAIGAENLGFFATGETRPVFFSVRIGSFTLGEVLQELKELKQLETKQQDVVLVVDNLDPSIRKKIEAEGFMVIARGDYS